MQNFSMKCFRSFQIFGVKSALLFLVLAANLIIIPAKAQDNSASDDARFEISRAAVIDLARIIRESEATARVRVLLDGKSAEFQQEFAEKETQLLAKEKELKAKESLITEDAYQEEVRAFQRDVAAIQQDIQNKRQSLDRALQEAQDKIKKIEVEGESGGNLVKVVLSGDYELKSIHISDAAKKESQEIINDLIIAAYNNAKENLKKKSAEELSKVTGGLNLPLDFKLPF